MNYIRSQSGMAAETMGHGHQVTVPVDYQVKAGTYGNSNYHLSNNLPLDMKRGSNAILFQHDNNPTIINPDITQRPSHPYQQLNQHHTMLSNQRLDNVTMDSSQQYKMDANQT